MRPRSGDGCKNESSASDPRRRETHREVRSASDLHSHCCWGKTNATIAGKAGTRKEEVGRKDRGLRKGREGGEGQGREERKSEETEGKREERDREKRS